MGKTDFRYVRPCGNCRGLGEVMGAAMRIYCHKCEGAGFFDAELGTDQPAAPMALAKEVRRLRDLVEVVSGDAEVNQRMRAENNKGPGGCNFTGD